MNSYLFSCNPNMYDILSSFIKNGFVDFSTYQNILIGDTVYLYITAPYSGILFKCRVKSILSFDEIAKDNEFNKTAFKSKDKYVRLIPVQSYLDKKDKLSKDILYSHGIKGFNFQLKLGNHIVKFLESI